MLRDGKTLQDCHFEHDEDEMTFHLGAFVDKKLVSVASFYFERHPKLPEQVQYRLRGMATLPQFQKQGLSSALLKTAFPMTQQNQAQILWCNARASAQGYYEKVGFETSGDYFDLPDIGKHILMFKRLLNP